MSQSDTPYPDRSGSTAGADGAEETAGGPDQQTVDLAHALFDLARQGRTDQLVAYVEAGAPANLTDPSGNSLLMLAAYHGHAELVRALARRGADVDRLNDRGQSPLAGAVFKGEQDVIDALLEHGADPDAGMPSARETARMFGRAEPFDRTGTPDRPEPSDGTGTSDRPEPFDGPAGT